MITVDGKKRLEKALLDKFGYNIRITVHLDLYPVEKKQLKKLSPAR